VTRAIRYVALLCVTFSTGAVIFGYLTFMSVSTVYNAFMKMSKLLCSVTKFLFPNNMAFFHSLFIEKRIV